MKNKTVQLMILSVLSMIVFASLVSATITLSSPELSKSGNSVNLTVLSDKNETITFLSLPAITQSGKTITFNLPSPLTLTSGVTQTVPIIYSHSGFDFKFGNSYSSTLIVNGSQSGQTTELLSFGVADFCDLGAQGDLTTDIKDVTVTGLSERDTEFYPFDEVEVEVIVKDNGNDDVDDVVVEWCLYDESAGECVLDGEENSFNINDGDKETITFKFSIDPKDLSLDNNDYTLFVKAYSDDQGEDKQCSGDTSALRLVSEDELVILGDIKITPETALCGSEVTLTADAWNIGSEDQDNVYVKITNSDLGINKLYESGDINSADKDKLTFTFNVPEGFKEGTYNIALNVYNEDDDLYVSEDDVESSYTKQLKVQGACEIKPQFVLNADLASDSVAGQELTVKATLTNSGTKTTTYTLNAVDYTSWAELVSIEPKTVVLGSGESKDVLFTFNVNEDVSGSQQFSIELASNNQLVATQPVALSVEAAKGFTFPLGNLITSDNWYLWAIGLINVIIVIVIIVVAIRIAKS